MKICISAKGKEKESLLDRRFGRCDYFQIYDTETGDFKVLENESKLSNGGAGIAASNQLIDEDIEVVITGNLGPNAFGIIEEEGIKAYTCESIAIGSVLEKYENGELKEIKSSDPANHRANR